MRYSVSTPLSGLVLAVLSCAVCGVSNAQQDFNSVLRRTPDAGRGQMLFETCAACHGGSGVGVPDGSVPAIAGQHFRVIVRELVDFSNKERWDPRMQHFSDERHLSGAQDIADLAAYISRLPPARSADQGNDEHVQRGAEVYARLCTRCHGPRAEGDNRRGFPRLAGQHREYLLSQMQYAVQDQRPNFSPQHVHLLQRLQAEDLPDLAQYLARLGP